MGLNQVRHAVRDHPGFTAAGARQQQKRPFYVLDGLLLLRI
jgi:hypothetical protein